MEAVWKSDEYWHTLRVGPYQVCVVHPSGRRWVVETAAICDRGMRFDDEASAWAYVRSQFGEIPESVEEGGD